MLSELQQHERRIETYRSELANWAADAVELASAIEDWQLDRVWRVVQAQGRVPAFPMRSFVERWVRNLRQGGPEAIVRNDSTARDLVRERETQLKRGRARLSSSRHLGIVGGTVRYRADGLPMGRNQGASPGTYSTDCGARAMLGTRERTLLLDSLRPPSGYRLRRAVGTSFTLDLMALLTAPLAFTFFDAHDDDGAPVADPVALLEALRRHAEKVTLFCQAGMIGVPRPDQPLLAFLEASVIAVQPPHKGGIFHPKLWVLNFQPEEGPAIYRVLCLSRNLTFARTWDTCLRLQGRLSKREGGFPRNEPLADLLSALPKLESPRPVTAELREDLERMAYEIRRVDFKTPRPFKDFRIHNFGLGQRGGWPFPKGGRSLGGVAVSGGIHCCRSHAGTWPRGGGVPTRGLR